jgi:hypothetical protein
MKFRISLMSEDTVNNKEALGRSLDLKNWYKEELISES